MKNIIITIAVLALGYLGYTQLSPNKDTQLATNESQGTVVEINDSINTILDDTREVVAEVSLTESEADTASEEAVQADVKVVADTKVASAGSYVDYEGTDISTLEGDIVLDFYASWCPSCRKLEKDINESLVDIPSDLTIVKVNYDTESELKSRYGVTKQHTLVQVDQQGNLIKKWSGGSTLESIVSNLE